MTVFRPVPASSVPGVDPSRPDGNWHAAEELLIGTEYAGVMAIGANGLCVPMPADLPRHGHPVIEGPASVLELVAPADLAAVIEAWKHTLIHGQGRVEVGSRDPGGGRMTLYFLDVRARHQVLLGVVVYQDVVVGRGVRTAGRALEQAARLAAALHELVRTDGFRPSIVVDRGPADHVR